MSAPPNRKGGRPRKPLAEALVKRKAPDEYSQNQQSIKCHKREENLSLSEREVELAINRDRQNRCNVLLRFKKTAEYMDAWPDQQPLLELRFKTCWDEEK